MIDQSFYRSQGGRSLDLSGSTNQLVTMHVGGQMFGVPILHVVDVLGACEMTKVPLAQPEVIGCLNIRGRIVTAIDLRLLLGLPVRPTGISAMNVIIEYYEEQYSLVVDMVGEVLCLSNANFQKNPSTLSDLWKRLSLGVYRLEEKLLMVLDVYKIPQLNSLSASQLENYY